MYVLAIVVAGATITRRDAWRNTTPGGALDLADTTPERGSSGDERIQRKSGGVQDREQNTGKQKTGKRETGKTGNGKTGKRENGRTGVRLKIL